MVSIHSRFLYILAGILTAGSAHAADATCKYLADANAKIYTIPTHLYQTETSAATGGKPRNSELIYLSDKSYFQVNGKWRVNPMTQKDMLDLRKKEEAESLANISCSAVRDEAVKGEAATLYRTHQQTPDETTDSQIWVSKSRGVPLKLEMDMNAGGQAGKSHRSIIYEYTNVHAPADVR